MKPELRELIDAYQRAVRASVTVLENAGVYVPRKDGLWPLVGPRRGSLGADAWYQMHGVGCTVHVSGVATDFDLGPGGESDGFDGWRLFRFTADHGLPCPYKNYRELDSELEAAASAGEIVRIGDSSLFRLAPSCGPTS